MTDYFRYRNEKSPWDSAPGAWVFLKDALPKVEKVFDISGHEAATLLRSGIEHGGLIGNSIYNSFTIPHRVVLDQPMDQPLRFGAWMPSDGGHPYVSVHEFGGWDKVDWGAGIVAKHPIEINWAAVQHICLQYRAGRVDSTQYRADTMPLMRSHPFMKKHQHHDDSAALRRMQEHIDTGKSPTAASKLTAAELPHPNVLESSFASRLYNAWKRNALE